MALHNMQQDRDAPVRDFGLLSDKNQDITLKQVFKFVEAKEAGKRSATHLLAPQHTDALSKSTYLSGRRESVKEGHASHRREQEK